jgi:hypothetical protein
MPALGQPELALSWISPAWIDLRRRRPLPGDAAPMARRQLRGGRLCARLEFRHPWPARCSSSDGRPSLTIALRGWPHVQLAGRPPSAARRLALRTIAARTLPPERCSPYAQSGSTSACWRGEGLLKILGERWIRDRQVSPIWSFQE